VQPSCQPLRGARACARLAAASNLRARSEGAVDLVDNDDLADPKWIIAPTVAGPRGAELEDLWHDMFITFLREPSILKSVVPEARETYVRVATRRHALNHLRCRSTKQRSRGCRHPRLLRPSGQLMLASNSSGFSTESMSAIAILFDGGCSRTSPSARSRVVRDSPTLRLRFEPFAR
jgi:hypothetical protein